MSELIDPKQTDVADISVELKNIIEALIFASDEPVNSRFIRSIVDEANKELSPHEQLIVNADIIKKAVAELNRGYAKAGASFKILEIAGGYVYATLEQFSSWVGKLAKEKARRRLSVTAVETLAIIAYKQPITKVEVEFIRGVNVDYIIKTLLEKDLIYISGRASTPGRPLLYGTTQKFLEHFGLNDISDLPKPREIEELIGETEAEVDRRLLAEQQQLEFKEELEEKLQGHEGTKQKPKEPKQPRVKIHAPQEPALPENSPVPAEPSAEEGTAALSDQEKLSAASEDLQHNSLEEKGMTGQKISENTAADMSELGETAEELEGRHDDEINLENEVKTAVKLFSDRGVEILESQTNIKEEKPNELDAQENREKVVNEKTAAERDSLTKEHAESTGLREAANQDRHHNEVHSETGWTKWKTKVKSFFQKIFG